MRTATSCWGITIGLKWLGSTVLVPCHVIAVSRDCCRRVNSISIIDSCVRHKCQVAGGAENWSCLVRPGRNSCLKTESLESFDHVISFTCLVWRALGPGIWVLPLASLNKLVKHAYVWLAWERESLPVEVVDTWHNKRIEPIGAQVSVTWFCSRDLLNLVRLHVTPSDRVS